MELITGHTGENHIDSNDDAAKYAALLGGGNYVLEKGSQFAYEISSNNLIILSDGEAVFQGRHARTKPTVKENCTIENGTQSKIRHDLIGIMYTNTGGIEKAEVKVIKGTPGTAGKDPSYPSGDIEGGATENFMPLWRVVLNGLSVSKVEKMYKVYHRIPIFLPPGTEEPTASMADGDEIYVYFQKVVE